MRTNEPFDYGGAGIDTPYERGYINYRPRIEYKKNVVDLTDLSGLGFIPEDDRPFLIEINSSSVSSLIEKIFSINEAIDKTKKKLESKLAGFSAPVHPSFRESVEKAFQQLGIQIPPNEIPFDVYKEALDNYEEPSNSIIVAIFEDYVSDVHGNLNAELYEDIHEIQKDFNEFNRFVKDGLLLQILSQQEADSVLKGEPAFIEKLKQKEKELIEDYASLLKKRHEASLVIEELENTQYGSDQYFKAEHLMETIERDIIKAEKTMNSKMEITDLAESKTDYAEDSVGLVDRLIDFDPYGENKKVVLYSVLRQFPDKTNARKGLKQMNILLKLVVDDKKNQMNPGKATLRGMSGIQTKTRANQDLINSVHFRNEVLRDMNDLMQNIDGEDGTREFMTFANHLVSGMKKSEQNYEEQASDFYKIHGMDYELRMERLNSLIQKDAARGGFQMTENVLRYLEDKNSQWPTEEKLSSWIEEYLQS